MNSQLNSCGVGTIVLVADNKEYICTSLQYDMSLNNIASASVVIGCGARIGKPDEEAPDVEELLKQVLSNRSQSYTGLVDCEIKEVTDLGDTGVTEWHTIFTGVIVTGCVVYKTGNPTVRAVRLQCMNKICKLFVSPLAGYYNMCGAAVIRYVGEEKAERQAIHERHTQGLAASDTKTGDALVLDVLEQITGKTLDYILAILIDKIIQSGSELADLEQPVDGSIAKVQNYLFSKYRISSEFGSTCESEFLGHLCEQLRSRISGTSIYDAMQSVILTNDFMLNLAPRFSDNDFKMEVLPSRAWESKSALTITSSKIIAIDSAYNPIVCLNTPDVFIVQLDSALEYSQGQSDGDALGLLGIYSSDPTIQEAVRNSIGKGQTLDSGTSAKLFKTKFYTAPKWTYSAFIATATQQGTKQQDKAATTTVEVNNNNTKQQAELEAMPDIDVTKTTELANEIAKSLYAHLYGSGDSANIQLLPSTRFGQDASLGCLEQHIGDLIDIKFETGTQANASPLNIRGVLEAIQYTYTSGQAGNVSYAIRLGKVRPLDTDETEVKGSLYQRVGK